MILYNAGEVVSEGAVAALTGVDRTYLDAAFAAIDRDHGSFDAYVAECIGIDAAIREAVRAALFA